MVGSREREYKREQDKEQESAFRKSDLMTIASGGC